MPSEKKAAEVKIGLSTYALFWEISRRVERPLDLPGMLERTASLGCQVLQICDYPAVEQLSVQQLKALRAEADSVGIELELGTRGVSLDHLSQYLDIAEALQATTLRSMVLTHQRDQAPSALAAIRSRLESQGVTLALETYEQLPTSGLIDIVRQSESSRVGIALDPANCVAALEDPLKVIAWCAPYTVNLHVKDFAFSRQEGWVGFTYSGAPLGEGLLDYAFEVAHVRPSERGISQIVEHWLPWQGTPEETITTERRWTETAVDYIRRMTND